MTYNKNIKNYLCKTITCLSRARYSSNCLQLSPLEIQISSRDFVPLKILWVKPGVVCLSNDDDFLFSRGTGLLIFVSFSSRWLNKFFLTDTGNFCTHLISPWINPKSTVSRSLIFNAAGLNLTQSSPKVAPCVMYAYILKISEYLACLISERLHFRTAVCCNSLHFANIEIFGVGRYTLEYWNTGKHKATSKMTRCRTHSSTNSNATSDIPDIRFMWL